MTQPSPSPMPLKNCPFCPDGGKPEIYGLEVGSRDDVPRRKHVICFVCKARTKSSYDLEEAVTAWNTRTPGSDAVGDVGVNYESPVKCAYCKRVNSRVCYKFHHEPPYANPATPEPVGDAKVLEALEIAIGYVSLVADGVGKMPILKDRAKSDCEIISSAINALQPKQEGK